MKKTPTELGRLIRDRRLELDMTQLDIAKRVNVDQGAVSSWERGSTKPVRKYRVPLAEALNLEPIKLFPDGKF